jgi:arabinose-5-phosphate isomerase
MQLNEPTELTNSTQDVLAHVREVLQLEASAVSSLIHRINDSTLQAIELLQNCSGRIIVTGMGKMGWIAHKAAATLSSVGSPAIFLHPGEAAHGDLGIVTANDVLLALSNSGETEELNGMLPFMHRWGIPVIAITGNLSSTLAKRASIVLDCTVDREADPVCPAPTCSTTAALALCDAIAIALMRQRGFDENQFALFHPGGYLGRKLLTTVKDVMITAPGIPQVPLKTSLKDAIVEMSNKSLGCTLVVDEHARLKGIFTDGDLRRTFQSIANPLENHIEEFMSPDPRHITVDQLAADALRIMQQNAITVIPVVDENRSVVGIVHMHELMRAGLA